MKMHMMDESTAREAILKAVGEYASTYLASTEWQEGGRIPYAGRVFGSEEVMNLADSMLDFWLTAGTWTERFERDFAEYLGVGYASLVNSGSSANLLAFMTLTAPELGVRAIRPGDEVITVAAGFPTTVSPIIQYGAVPVFVDVTVPQYNVDVSQLEGALSGKTKAVMLAHTLGNPFDLAAVKGFCDTHGLWLIEDNCDALGSVYELDGAIRLTGTVGDIGTSSFYPPHHMTMGEGGAVYTGNPLLHKVMRSMRDWGRDCTCASGQDNRCGNRFAGQYGELPFGYDHKYVYSHFGYNLKATDMQAAVGCAQLGRLPSFIEARRRNHAYLAEALSDLEGRLVLPQRCPGSDPSWFGFTMTARSSADRARIVRALEEEKIQTRMLFAGNIIRHPCFDSIRGTDAYRVVGELPQTDRIMEETFWVGVYPGMTDVMLDKIAEVLHKAVR